MIDVVDNGKKVIVVVEFCVCFDEEVNIEWLKCMIDVGICVVLGVLIFKIYFKLCIVSCEECGLLVNYVYFGIGNFNEKMVKIYIDFSLFICN